MRRRLKSRFSRIFLKKVIFFTWKIVKKNFDAIFRKTIQKHTEATLPNNGKLTLKFWWFCTWRSLNMSHLVQSENPCKIFSTISQISKYYQSITIYKIDKINKAIVYFFLLKCVWRSGCVLCSLPTLFCNWNYK